MVWRVVRWVLGLYLLFAVVGVLLRAWAPCGAAARPIAGVSVPF